MRGAEVWAEGEEICCRAPRGALSPDLAEELRSNRAQLLALLGQRRRHVLPSFAQEGLWLLDRIEPGSGAYNVAAAWRIDGDLRISALLGACAAIVARHEPLRSSFMAVEGRPVAVIAERRPPCWRQVDLSRLTGGDATRETRRLAAGEAHRPFDLSRGPLFRVLLIATHRHQHLLLACFHHIAADGGSLSIFSRELGVFYGWFTGRPGMRPLAELPMSHTEHSRKQRRRLSDPALAEALAYWRPQLDDPPPALQLPYDRPAPAARSRRGGCRRLALNDARATALRNLGRRYGASLFMTFLAAFMALLSRYSGQRRLAVGTPVAQRDDARATGLIGCLVNTLVLRGDLARASSFGELLAQVRDTVLEAWDHQELPFEKLVEALRPERGVERHPLFQVTLAMRHEAAGASELGDLPLVPVELARRPVRFDLGLQVFEQPQYLRARLLYDRDLFDDTTGARLVEHLATLLDAAARDPERPLAELSLASPAQRHQLCLEWSADRDPASWHETLHQGFADQVRRTPDSIAVRCGERVLSYGQLERGAAHLCRRLRARGVGPEVVVAICVERSLAMVRAVLAVLAAGGAYLPLRPFDPVERRRRLLAASGAALVLARRPLLCELTAPDRPGLALDDGAVSGAATEPVDGAALGANAAYLIHTSGSLGEPKAVVVEHRQILSHLGGIRRLFAPFARRSVAMVQPLAVDGAKTQLFLPLLTGGTLHLIPAVVAADAGRIGDYFTRHPIDMLKIAPSHVSALAAARSSGPPLPHQRLLVGGEALRRPLAVELLARAPFGCRIWNHYGPTETAVGTLTCRLRNERGGAPQVPIGRPLAGVRAFVLDRCLREVPLGVPGELLIGGASVSRGYHRRPARTAAVFVPDPAARLSPGSRLYRTGDRVRHLDDGRLEFLGRFDRQVKIRGWRVEIGEIEAALAACPGLREVVVTVQDRGRERRLVAYVVADPPPGPSGTELRALLRRRLPEPLLPAAFVHLEELPRRPQGKVDLDALPAPAARSEDHRPGRAPRGPLQSLVAGIWAEVLELDAAGTDDDFFALGGHSLLATRLVARLSRAVDLEIPLRWLFEHPTVEGLSRILDRRLRGAVRRLPPLTPGQDGAPSPLSFAQQRLWFLDRLEPASRAYHLTSAVRLTGALDRVALERALREITRRHEILRTAFPSHEGRPAQHAGAVDLRLPVVDLTAVAGDVGGRALDLGRRFARLPFDLARGSLLRPLLLRLDERHHHLLICWHHIVSDGASRTLFWRELETLYAAFSAGQPSPLAELPVQFADFAAWQRRWLNDAALVPLLSYWRARLADLSELDLPVDRPPPARPTYRGAMHRWRLPAALTAALERLARDAGTTLFATLAAAFTAWLSRLTGQRDVVIGSPVAQRPLPELEELIGPFVNSLVLRADLGGEPGFRDHLHQVHKTVLDGLAHQDLPFEKLVRELVSERDLSRHPLFRATLALSYAARSPERLRGLGVGPLDLRAGAVRFDLELQLWRQGQDLECWLIYACDLFDPTTIGRWASQLRLLLASIAGDPDRRLRDHDLLSPGERQQMLHEWNDSARCWPDGHYVHQLFEDQARRRPDAAALSCARRHLTYGELDRRAGVLAGQLGRLGVGPEEVVGLALERSLELIIAMLAILKAGGAYLPLDPAYPRKRLEFMVRDAGAGWVIGRRRPRRWPAGVRQLRIDRRGELSGGAFPRPGAEPRRAGGTPSGAGRLAYVIYTSGSTGRPKGVMVHHRGLVNYLRWAQDAYEVTAARGAPVISPLGFDLTVTSLYLPLLAGRTAVLLQEDVEPAALAAALAGGDGYSFVKLTPAHLQALGPLRPRGANRDSRRIILGGEALWWDQLATWQAPGTLVVNEYGPTETVVGSCVYQAAWQAGRRGPVPIGRPIANTRLRVLDCHLWPVPLGVAGELHIAGAGVTRGYLERPSRTARAFLPDPGSRRPGERLYKTGDRVRYLADGHLEYLGRGDHQVKIRGFRVEPGEVEAVLRRHPAIGEVVVVAAPEGNRLLAYVTSRAEPPSHGQLRRFLRRALPEFMLPSVFVWLPEIPLGASRKIDRSALPPPPPDRPAIGTPFAEPKTPLEDLLATIWAWVLGLREVGADDDFFELGGHSLTATQVISRICRSWGVELPLRALFEHPTVARLAKVLEEAVRQGVDPAWPDLVPVDRRRPLELSFAQQRLWFLDRLIPARAAYNVPMPMRLEGRLDAAALGEALNGVIRRHEILRTRFPSHEGRPYQVISQPVSRSLPRIDLGRLAAGRRAIEAGRLVDLEARRCFDLARGPLLRAVLLRLDDRRHILATTLHHTVCDAWSFGIFRRELAALYSTASGRPAVLAELPVQYADFAAWQRTWLSGAVLDRQLSYWRHQLRGLPALQLPADQPRPSSASYRGGKFTVALGEPSTLALEALSRRAGTTLYMTLLAAFATLLRRLAGQSDFAVGSPIANRNRTEIEPLIGFFTNTLVMRCRPRAAMSFEQLLGELREATIEAYMHQDLPFERLVEELGIERDLAVSPLFQVAFVMQPGPRQVLELPGVRMEPQPFDTGTAKFDLTLNLGRGPRGLAGHFEYSSDLFDRTTIARLAGSWQTLVRALASGSESSLDALPLLSGAELHHLLHEWNDTRPAGPPLPLIRRFATQAERRPGATAVVCGQAALSYGRLDRDSERLARHLRSLGVGCDSLVGLCAERSIEMVVWVVAVLKAGAALVPLDPDHPPARLSAQLAAVDGWAVVGRAEIGRLPASARAVPRLDAGWPEAAAGGELSAEGCREPQPDSIGYVIHTSGSTGQPKGIALPHRVLSCLVEWHHGAMLRGRPTLQFAALSFDVSQQEIFTALCSGGCLHVVAGEQRADPVVLAEHLSAVRIEKAVLPGVMLQRLAELSRSRPELALSLKEVIATGEQLKVAASVGDLFTRLEGASLHNHYGPSETHVVTAYSLPVVAERWPSQPPIGRPITGSRIYLLDRRLEMVALGATGELHIGGLSLARGYLRQPATTAERFVPDPWCAMPGERLYRSGDLSRCLADGSIEFLGRADFQLKIRGFRVEPGEIEAVLTQHASIRQAVVVARSDPGLDRRLVAYLVSDAGLEPPIDQLRAWLRRQLPEYMLPAAFVFLPALPVNANGKVDRRALPTPATRRPRLAGQLVAPRTPVEEILAAIWGQLLGLTSLGVDDNFFALGGHSLLATQVMSRIQRSFDVELPLRTLFEGPTIAQLAESLDQALEIGIGIAAPPILPAGRDRERPLSFSQQRLWFLHQLAPESVAYNMPTARLLIGRLDVRALALALGEIVRRHQILRTTYPAAGGRPRQHIIAAAGRAPLARVDLTGLQAGERHDEARRRLLAAARRPFDLARQQPLRVFLVELEVEEHVLLLVQHHIASDGWSEGIFYRELSTLYQAFAAGANLDSAVLSELEIQYADYALWQREWLRGEVLEAQLAYWRRQLAGLPALELPTDRPRPLVRSDCGAVEAFRLSAEHSRSLEALSIESGVSLYMSLLASFMTLLARLTGQDEVVLGTLIANRHRREIEDLIGFFVNSLVLRGDLSAPGRAGGPLFRQLLGRVKTLCLEAYEHQDLPFEKVVEELEPVRDPTRSPLFQVLFVGQNTPEAEVRIGALEVSPFGLGTGIANYDLKATYRERGERIAGYLTYNPDLFDRTTVARLARYYEAITVALVENPERGVAEIPLLDPAQRHQLLSEWNDTAAAPAGCVLSWLEAQVVRTPEAVAATGAGGQLSYAELDTRAAGLAHRLRASGMDSEQVVALLAPRDLDFLIAVVGILEAGAVYLPLAPGHPPWRLARVLARAAPAQVVVSESLDETLEQALAVIPEGRRPPVRRLGELLAGPRVQRPRCRSPRPEQLAYAIFTSGSTGAPKGAMVSHRGMRNHLRAKINDLGLCPADVVAQTASQDFDISVWQLLAPLLTGGQVHVVAQEVVYEPGRLLEDLAAARVSVLEIVPSYMGVLLDEIERRGGDRPLLETLRWLMPTGEALPPTLARRWLTACPGVPLINAYGPTECSDDVTHQVFVAPPAAGSPVPIGRPLGNLRVYPADRLLEPAPPPAAGELCVAGAGVARGYLGEPARTAPSFVPDPHSYRPGGRLYRTGDLGRWLTSGEIDFMGRIDHQVKIRGFRIEPGEIESTLLGHPAVGEAAVLVTRSGETPALAAFVVPDPDAVPAAARDADERAAGPEGPQLASGVRDHLAERLPAHMVPATFLVLDAMPRLASGKIDGAALRRLPLPGGVRYGVRKPPRSPAERRLLQVWQDVLGLDDCGVDDSFFDLGGHSLLAIRLMAEIESRFGTRLPLASLFGEPTVEAMARRLGAGSDRSPAGRRALVSPPLVEIHAGSDSIPPFFCVHPAGGHVVCYFELARRLGPEQPFYGLQATTGRHQDIGEMAAAYVDSIGTVEAAGPYLLGGWSMGGVVAFEMARLLRSRGHEVALLALLDASAPGTGAENRGGAGDGRRRYLFARVVGLPVGSSLAPGELSMLTSDQALRRILRQLKTSDRPAAVDLDQLRRLYRVFRSNLLAVERYSPEPQGGQILLFRPEENRAGRHGDPIGRWSALAQQVELLRVPGDHYSMVREPQVEVLGRHLRERLRQARASLGQSR